MSLKAYKVEKLAEEPSFKPNDLLEYIFEEEDIDAWFGNQDGVEYFAWIEKGALKKIEKVFKKCVEDYEDDRLDEDIEFDGKDIEETKRVLEIIRKDLADKKRVMYIVW